MFRWALAGGLMLAAIGCASTDEQSTATTQHADMDKRVNCTCGSWASSHGAPPDCKWKAEQQQKRELAAKQGKPAT
jgi:hypothetical protein